MSHIAHKGCIIAYVDCSHHEYAHIAQINGDTAKITPEGQLVITDHFMGTTWAPAQWNFCVSADKDGNPRKGMEYSHLQDGFTMARREGPKLYDNIEPQGEYEYG